MTTMTTMTYRYTGPHSAITLKVSDGAGGLKDQDIILWHDQPVSLPPEHDITATLLHQGLLVPLDAAPAEPAPAPAPAAATPPAPRSSSTKAKPAR